MEQQTLYKLAKYWKEQHDLMYLIWVSTSIVIFGLVMNYVVIVENGGRMPVANTTIPWDSVNSHFDFSDPSTIKYSYLADIYRVRGSVYSLGDFILSLGLLSVFILFIIKFAKTRRFKHTFSKCI